ncbi:MAG: hypothetical protein ACOYIE_09300, partial [Agathobaculum sp.]|uniref:hypothetical protein n=1 Tax=Agathobaculum sp. TaxID=2048138 RepID=UPI003D92AC19
MAKGNIKKKPISEDEYTTNKVLTVFSVCLLGVLVLMIVQRLLDYTNTWRTGMIVVKALFGVGVLGVIWAVCLFVREHAGKRDAARHIVCGRNVLIASVILTGCMMVVHSIGTQPIKVFYVLLPVLAVYYLIYHSYAPEFFTIAVDCGIAGALIWIARRAAASASYGKLAWAALAAAVVLAAAQLICVSVLRGRKG